MESSVTSSAASLGAAFFIEERISRVIHDKRRGQEFKSPTRKTCAKSLFRNILPISPLSGKI
jgi:hypothetical protein